jgi:hypothetical protein
MCTIITAYVPVDALGAAARVLEERKYGVQTIHNPHVQRGSRVGA